MPQAPAPKALPPPWPKQGLPLFSSIYIIFFISKIVLTALGLANITRSIYYSIMACFSYSELFQNQNNIA